MEDKKTIIVDHLSTLSEEALLSVLGGVANDILSSAKQAIIDAKVARIEAYNTATAALLIDIANLQGE